MQRLRSHQFKATSIRVIHPTDSSKLMTISTYLFFFFPNVNDESLHFIGELQFFFFFIIS